MQLPLHNSQSHRHAAHGVGLTVAVPGLLGYLGSHENVVTRLSKSHDVLAGMGLQRSIISFLAFGERPMALAVGPEGSGKTHLLSMVERQARDTFPLLSVHVSYRVPSLSGRNRVVKILRELWHTYSDGDEVESLSPNELLHNGPAFLTRISTEVGGLLLIIDDIDEITGGSVPTWLPIPLPPGLHCIASASSSDALTGAYGMNPACVAVRQLSSLSILEKQQFTSKYAPQHQELALSALTATGQPLTARACRLIASLVALKPDSCPMQFGEDTQAETAYAYLDACKEQYAGRALQVMALLSCTCHGLYLSDLAALCKKARGRLFLPTGLLKNPLLQEDATVPNQGTEDCLLRDDIVWVLEFCQPLLRDNLKVHCLGGDFAVRAVRTFCSDRGVDLQLCETDLRLHVFSHFASFACDAVSTVAEYTTHSIEEAAAQLLKANLESLGSTIYVWQEALLSFVTCLPVLRHFARREDEVIALWRKVGIDQTGKKLLEAASQESWTTQDHSLVGRLLSIAGEFVAARELLGRTPHTSPIADPLSAHQSSMSPNYHRAESLVAVANNEVRYWDSRRDWASPEALSLLLDSGREAVQLLERLQLRRPAEKLLLARALSRRANGCFKAGCVSAPGSNSQNSYFDEADACIARAVSLLQGRRVQVLGEVVLVGGVTTLCRAHSLSRQHRLDSFKETAISAMLQFYRAEAILRAAVGKINEKSIYTHGNLAELMLNDLHEPFLGLLHHRQSCIVAVRTFGLTHANANRKLQELADICQQLGWADFAEWLHDGRPQDIAPIFIKGRLETLNVALWGPNHPLIVSAFIGELRASLDDNTSTATSPEFWEGLWQDLGVPRELAQDAGLAFIDPDL
mmetsp:Transcript_109992/g.245841  ORF Transcript_109992/g.245841 Transcript_109992/m.245841 type:complete len:863 (-) Transcript_109992:6-2594(-)